MSELVLLGRITDAHGLKGEVKIASFTAHPEDIGAYGALTSEDGARRFELSGVRPLKGGAVIARVCGVGDRTAAEKLRGVGLYVARDTLPPAEEEEYYHSDLIGLEAVAPDGAPIGEVTAVHNFGAGDLLELRLFASRRTELVPFDGTNVPSIDLDRRRLTVAYPLGAGEGESNEAE